MVQISFQNPSGKVVFLGDSMEPPPPGTNGSEKYFGQSSVNPNSYDQTLACVGLFLYTEILTDNNVLLDWYRKMCTLLRSNYMK